MVLCKDFMLKLTAANLLPSIKAGCWETGRASNTWTWGLGRSDELELLRSWFRTFWITGLAVWRISAPTFLTSLFMVKNQDERISSNSSRVNEKTIVWFSNPQKKKTLKNNRSFCLLSSWFLRNLLQLLMQLKFFRLLYLWPERDYAENLIIQTRSGFENAFEHFCQFP